MNPWTNIDLKDYEGHMSHLEVAQAHMLSEEFKAAVTNLKPRKVGLIGCAGGNGLESGIVDDIDLVLCVDINKSFINKLTERYLSRIKNLRCIVGSIEDLAINETVDCVFCGLILEYTELEKAISNISTLISDGGTLVALLQNKIDGLPIVSATEFAARLEVVEDRFTYIDISYLTELVKNYRLHQVSQKIIELKSGKKFTVAYFKKTG